MLLRNLKIQSTGKKVILFLLAFSFAIISIAQVTGRVTDEQNNPIEGVSVFLKNIKRSLNIATIFIKIKPSAHSCNSIINR